MRKEQTGYVPPVAISSPVQHYRKPDTVTEITFTTTMRRRKQTVPRPEPAAPVAIPIPKLPKAQNFRFDDSNLHYQTRLDIEAGKYENEKTGKHYASRFLIHKIITQLQQ